MESIGEIGGKKTSWLNNRGWVSGRRRKRYSWMKIFRGLGKKFGEYCENSSLVGFRYFSESHRPWIERVIWIILHASTLCMLGFLVKSAWREYVDLPVVTVVHSDNYPSGQLQFPGIAICNINRISRKAAMKFANEIVSSNITNMEFREILDLIRQLGALYDSDADPNMTLEKHLDEILLKYYKGHYDVTSIMKNLSPSCAESLSSCHFQGDVKNCSDIFVFRKTQDGFCCTFNYARESDDISTIDELKKEVPLKPYNIRSLGISNGLSLVMEPFVDDYYYPMLPIIGWKVTVFNPEDYPDNESGSVAEALLAPSTETFVELDVTSFYSTNTIRDVSMNKRRCIFQNELPVLYTGYTYSDCLVDCRAAVIWDTCSCRPFYFPRRGNDQYTRKVCNTADAECLHAHKDIYSTVLSDKVEDPEKEEPKYVMSPDTAKRCSDCYPACDDVRYYLQSSTAYLQKGIYHTELLDNVRLENQSVVHIYFTKHGSVRLRQDIAYYWYELLSNIGGICGVFIGFSLISVAEFLYFTLCMIHEFYRGKRKTTEMKSTLRTSTRITRSGTKWRKRENANPFAGNLYWNEFLAQSGVTVNHGKIQRLQVRNY